MRPARKVVAPAEWQTFDPVGPCRPASDHAADGHVVGRVEERHVGALISEQAAQILTTSRIAAPEAVFTELPQIANLRDRRTGETTVVDLVSGIGCRILEVSMQRV